MGTVVPILKGDAKHREIEGYAEILEVLNYLGKGLYFVACVFEKDPMKAVVHRLYTIGEKLPEVKAAGAENAE